MLTVWFLLCQKPPGATDAWGASRALLRQCTGSLFLFEIKSWQICQVCGIYLAGVVSGSLATSLTDPQALLAGASGSRSGDFLWFCWFWCWWYWLLVTLLWLMPQSRQYWYMYRVGDMMVGTGQTIDDFPFTQVVFMPFFWPTCPPSSSTGKPLLSHLCWLGVITCMENERDSPLQMVIGLVNHHWQWHWWLQWWIGDCNTNGECAIVTQMVNDHWWL